MLVGCLFSILDIHSMFVYCILCMQLYIPDAYSLVWVWVVGVGVVGVLVSVVLRSLSLIDCLLYN